MPGPQNPVPPEDDPIVLTDATAATLDPAPGAEILRRFAPGETLDERYTIIEEIGSGGMGIVYKALDRTLNRPVALKLLRRRAMTETGTQRFRRELMLARKVHHPNVCRLHDLGEVDGIPYISMEHVEGQRLDRLILSMGHLSPKQTVALGRQLCAGLAAIHAQGIVHRDLKPSNLMVDHKGHVFIMDFGLAVRPGTEDRVTSTGAVLGTLAYLSPEQARGSDIGAPSDLYAVGLILFEMLTGRCAPADDVALPLALRDAHERCPPPGELVPDVPAPLDDLVLRCLRRDIAERFTSAAEVEQGLGQIQSGLTATSTARRALPPRERSTWFLAPRAMTVLAVLLAAVALLAAWLGRTSSPAVPAQPVSVAFMPLRFSGPEDAAYLKDLLPLLLSEQLRGASGLESVPFASTRGLGEGAAAGTVGDQLGADAVVVGDLAARGATVTLSLRVLRPGAREPVWSSTVEGTAPALISRAPALGGDIEAALGVPRSAARPSSDRNAVALAAYLEGHSYLEGWDAPRNPPRAAEGFRRALEADGAFAEAHAGLALALWKQYEDSHDAALVDKAQGAARRAVELQPDLPEAQLALGTIELGMGRSVQAQAAFARAQELSPGNDAVCRRIATAYARLGRDADAVRFFDRAITLRPRNWENQNMLAMHYLERGQVEPAKNLYRKVIELRPDSDIGYSNLAAAHLQAGEMKAAEPLLKAALAIRPSARANSNLGVVYYALGQYPQAASAFEAAVALDPDPGYYGNLGDARRQMGLAAEARLAYQEAIERAQTRLRVNPQDSVYRAALAMWLSGAGRCAEARPAVRRASAADARNPAVHYYAAVSLALCGEADEAVRFASLAIAEGGEADIKTNPDLVPVLRAHPRGRALLEASAP